ncbi:MAG: phosphoenolpyruvate synthase PpsA [Deltaproteobacteria bacterium RBG_13_49_15]|nr:MAG: phosphoenolpyruvate synthase PpsA [Deltaproteobacteria bacterium RBG_13_49_15]
MHDQMNDLDQFDLSFKVFYDLMSKRVSEILLVSSPYDAFIMEEDGRLAERIIHEYRGLNLTRPPRLTWVSSAQEALDMLTLSNFDLVLTMPRLGDMHPQNLGKEIKKRFPRLPVFLLTHDTGALLSNPKPANQSAIDKTYIWTGNTDLLLALIKNVEDRMNVVHDTQRARVRVILMVEDSPVYYSSLLPFLYKEVVMQTQAVMEESLNEEHRILRMRARPKILHAENYEDAESIYRSFKPFLLCVISDVRFPRNLEVDPEAGFSLISMIKKELPDLPLFIMSSEEKNREKAQQSQAFFLNKNSPTFHTDIRSHFTNHLGFGHFVFKLPDGKEVARVSNLYSMEKMLPSIPDESVYYHAKNDHFSTWLMARSEIQLSMKLKPVKVTDFTDIKEMKAYLISCLQARRLGRQKGVVADFSAEDFDPEMEFAKIGKGSLGGKARGLAFMYTQFKAHPEIAGIFPQIDICVPKTLVISTEAFDSFIRKNDLKDFSDSELTDSQITGLFLKAELHSWLLRDLRRFLESVKYPLAVRSSSLLEDAIFQPFAGIYRTYMIPNHHPDIHVRLHRLARAIKLVYASTYLEAPRSYAKNTLHRIEEEKMAVIIQKATGSVYGNYYYPSISGVAQSYNFYPISNMKSEEGVAHIALGFGKTIVEGFAALRFSPKYPQFLPQFSSVEDILTNSQRYFYAMKMTDEKNDIEPVEFGGNDPTIIRLEIADLAEDKDHAVIRRLSSTYSSEDHRIRDTGYGNGYPILTFASVLKHKSFPLPEILTEVLKLGEKGMASPVEIEFAVDLQETPGSRPQFTLLQIRPMGLRRQQMEVEISEEDIKNAFCLSTMALGHGITHNIKDILFVQPDRFDPARTVEIAHEIGIINKEMITENRRYLLIGPGRWGSADRFLGIPVTWNEISQVGSIIENRTGQLRADPSQGSHFFHNITSLGISYLTISEGADDFIDWKWLLSLIPVRETAHLRHVRLEHPMSIKADGRRSRAVITCC